MRPTLTLLVILAFSNLKGSDPQYAVSLIPEELKKNVNAVVREDKMVFTILSKSKGTLHVFYAVTIFNDRANGLAEFVVGYDKLSRITNINASVYDGSGKQIKKLKNNEIIDQAAFGEDALFSDNRVKIADLTQGTYPYTVVFEYDKDYNFLFQIDGSQVLSRENMSVESFSYQLIYPPDLRPRYKAINLEIEPKKEFTPDGKESLTWTLNNIMPITVEPFSSPDAVFQGIIAAPTAFEFDGYGGNMTTWDEFGAWIRSLNKGRQTLPPGTIEKIKALTAAEKTNEEKIKRLYEYLQGKTRYVGIQLGIGGFQPFEASVVDKTGYGDCKALSNYMIAMLESIGIKANYVLINAGENSRKLDTGFPSSQFNHAIVAVPNGMDTIWLECTSQTNPFGYQGNHTGDRQALLITDNGASIVNTSRYRAEQNTLSRTAEVFIERAGNAKARIKTTYSGLEYEHNGLHFIVNYQYEEQKKWLLANTKIPSFDITSFSMTNHKEKIPAATVALDLALNRYATVSGKRIFLTPNLMNRSSFIPEKIEQRKTKIVRKKAFTHSDTIRYHLPEGVYAEFLPDPVKLITRFGEYHANFTIDDGVLIYVRKIRVNKGEFPPESYPELIDFYKNLSKADNTKVVFLSKT